MKKKNRVRKLLLLMVCFTMLWGNVFTSFAAPTVKLLGTNGGTVTAVYATSGSKKNGYYAVDKTKVILTYTPPEGYPDCSDSGLGWFGLATDIAKPTTDASETQIYPGAGWTCNGHTSGSAEWIHYFAAATVPSSLQKDAKISETLTVTLEQFKTANYVWGGPGLGEGDGVEGTKYGWVVAYKKLPEENEIIIPNTVDGDVPVLSASVKASGTTAKDVEGKTWGTSATITATAKDNKARPDFIYLYFGSTRVGQLASNPDNAKTITGSQVVTSNGQYKVYAQDLVGNSSELAGDTTYVDCIDLTPPTIQSYTLDSQTPAKSHTLTVKAIDSDVGLAAQAYSWDNGATWTSINNKIVTANGSYTVKVRDALGNTSNKTITVNNIDTIPPVIGEVKAEPDGNTAQDDNGKTWGTKGKLTINASDQGLGLAEKAYSWDSGATWTADKVLSVTENKEYLATVRDKADNRDSKKVTVDFVDLVEPTVLDFAPDSTEWAKQHVLTVTAEDLQSGLATEAYSYDNGETWTSDNTLTVSENGTYKVIVRDRVGNGEAGDTDLDTKKNIKIIVVDDIDTTPPILEQSQTPTEWTNDCVTLSVKAVDEGSGLAEHAYSWNGGISWTTESTFTVKENGDYSVIVRDKADNWAEANYQVTNIDKVAPTVNVSQNITAWTNQDVTLTIDATDKESGLTKQPYSWTNGSEQSLGTAENTVIVKENDTYIITVFDNAGNKTVVTHPVTNIDKVKPEVSVARISPKASKKWIVGKAVLKATAKDSDSGLADAAYSWDDGKSWKSAAKKTISKGGTYTVVVRDKAGNTTVCKHKITKDKVIPTPPETPVDPDPPYIPPVTPTQPETPKPKPIIKILTEEIVEPTPIIEVAEEPKEPEIEPEEPEEKPIIKLEEEPEPIDVDIELEEADGGTRRISWKPFELFERIAKSALKAILIVCLLFLIFLFFKTIPVYGLMEEDSYKLLGRAVIRKKKEIYFVKVPKRILDRGDTSKYKLRFGKNFAKRKEDEALTIQLPEEKTVETVIKRDVPFDYSE